jgi:hypothetical protein
MTVMLSKLLMDGPSARTIRPVLLRQRYPHHFPTQSKSKINEIYGRTIWTAERVAGEDRRQEIQKRRERGRLVRSSLIPALLAIWIVIGQKHIAMTIAWMLLCYAILLFLCAFSEVEIFRACRRDTLPDEDTKPKID